MNGETTTLLQPAEIAASLRDTLLRDGDRELWDRCCTALSLDCLAELHEQTALHLARTQALAQVVLNAAARKRAVRTKLATVGGRF